MVGQKRVQSGAVFWPSTWRSKLCSCSTCQVKLTCLSRYWLKHGRCNCEVSLILCLCGQESLSAAGLSFLLDESDTVLAYENKGKNNEETRQGHDPLMSALDNLNRVQQLEIIHGTQYYKNYTQNYKYYTQTLKYCRESYKYYTSPTQVSLLQ